MLDPKFLNAIFKMSWFDDFSEALRFLTVLPFPVGRKSSEAPRDLARAVRFFPAAGWIIAAISWVIFKTAGLFFPHPIPSLALLAGPILLSGGLHMDGFADFCDGFFSGRDRAGTLAIMKDSRVGAWAVIGSCLLLLIKWEFLKVLSSGPGAFFTAILAGRMALAGLSAFLPYAGAEDGLGRGLAGRVGTGTLLAAGLWLVPLALFYPRGLMLFAAASFFILALGIWFKKKLGGFTGDLLGATSELTELFVLAVAACGVRA